MEAQHWCSFARPKQQLKLSPHLKACVHYIKHQAWVHYIDNNVSSEILYFILFMHNAYLGDYFLF